MRAGELDTISHTRAEPMRRGPAEQRIVHATTQRSFRGTDASFTTAMRARLSPLGMQQNPTSEGLAARRDRKCAAFPAIALPSFVHHAAVSQHDVAIASVASLTPPTLPSPEAAGAIDRVVQCARVVAMADGSARFQLQFEPGVLHGATLSVVANPEGGVQVRLVVPRGVRTKDRELVVSLARRVHDAGFEFLEIDSDA